LGRFTKKIAAAFTRLGRFLREVRAELRKVIWPNRRETILYTSVVLLSVGAVALVIWFFDSILSVLVGFLIR
jgi:preprotein translocase subunit SecE